MKQCSLCNGKLKIVMYCRNCHILHVPFPNKNLCALCDIETESFFACPKCKIFYNLRDGITEIIMRGGL